MNPQMKFIADETVSVSLGFWLDELGLLMELGRRMDGTVGFHGQSLAVNTASGKCLCFQIPWRLTMDIQEANRRLKRW